jgi:hypothetical protein
VYQKPPPASRKITAAIAPISIPLFEPPEVLSAPLRVSSIGSCEPKEGILSSGAFSVSVAEIRSGTVWEFSGSSVESLLFVRSMSSWVDEGAMVFLASGSSQEGILILSSSSDELDS